MQKTSAMNIDSLEKSNLKKGEESTLNEEKNDQKDEEIK